MNLTNMSYLEYQRQHSKFRLFLATSRDILPPAGATGQCVCHKPKALSASRSESTYVVKSLFAETQSLYLDIEKERLKKHSHPEQSSVKYLLSPLVAKDIRARRSEGVLLKKSDVYPLLLNSSLSGSEMQGLSGYLRNLTVSKKSHRMKRAPVMAIAAQALKFSVPYIVEYSPKVFGYVKRQLKAKVLTPPSSRSSVNLAAAVQQRLGGGGSDKTRF